MKNNIMLDSQVNKIIQNGTAGYDFRVELSNLAIIKRIKFTISLILKVYHVISQGHWGCDENNY